MKVFNGRAATDEYMSTHSLTFSTPELTLKKFALWLGEQVDDPTGKDNVPRLMLYIEDKGNRGVKKDSDLIPDINDTFKPSGAVTDMYSGMVSSSSCSCSCCACTSPTTAYEATNPKTSLRRGGRRRNSSSSIFY